MVNLENLVAEEMSEKTESGGKMGIEEMIRKIYDFIIGSSEDTDEVKEDEVKEDEVKEDVKEDEVKPEE